MLDHDHGVAEVAQPLQRLHQPRIVALVQADRGLVQHIQYARETGTDLRREPDAMALAAGERAGGAGQGQVIEPTSCRKERRSRISFKTRAAISFCCALSTFGTVSNHSPARRTESLEI